MEGGKAAGAAEAAGKPDNKGSLSFTVPSILFGEKTANIVIKANLVNSSATSSSDLIKPKVSPYEDPGMNVLGSTLNDKTLTLNCSLNTPKKEDYKYELQLEGENDVWVSSSEENKGNPPSSFILKNLPENNRVARVQITYTYPNNTTRARETIKSYSNTFVIFAVGPTVSYRKNYLGINNRTPAEGTVVDIITTQGRDKIKFSDGTNIIIELDLSKVYDDNNTYPAITVKKGATEYTLFFD